MLLWNHMQYNRVELMPTFKRLYILLTGMPAFQKWASADLNGKFKLPMKNEFIPTNFEIYPLEKDSPSVPTLIKASGVSVQLGHPSVVTDVFLNCPGHSFPQLHSIKVL